MNKKMAVAVVIAVIAAGAVARPAVADESQTCALAQLATVGFTLERAMGVSFKQARVELRTEIQAGTVFNACLSRKVLQAVYQNTSDDAVVRAVAGICTDPAVIADQC